MLHTMGPGKLKMLALLTRLPALLVCSCGAETDEGGPRRALQQGAPPFEPPVAFGSSASAAAIAGG